MSGRKSNIRVDVKIRGRDFRLKITPETASNILVFLIIYWYLFAIFTPALLFSKTITTGGDTASHYYPAKFQKEELLPRGHVIGWLPGWYGGMPLFQFYFPVLFILIAVLGYIIPLQIAFKLVSCMNVFILPLTTFLAMRVMRFRYPMPIIAAIFTLPFLFMESHSMWGGNIPSTLAGEFTYGVSMALMVLLLAMIYRGVEERRWALRNAVFMALVCLTHVYTIIFTVASIPFLYFTKDKKEFIRRIVYSLRVYPLAVALTGFWLLPLLSRHKYTAVYDFVWNITEELFPKLLWPFIFLSIFGLHYIILNWDKRAGFFLFSFIMSLVLFRYASFMGAGMVDIRFLPFGYLYMLLIAAYGFSELTKKLEGIWVLPLIVIFLTLFWINEYNVTLPKEGLTYDFLMRELSNFNYHGFSPAWVKWNYEGFEKKIRWPQYKSVNDFLKGDQGSPRVKFEHHDKHNEAGTVRAFESVPLFSGRPILEGLYMQSIHTSIFSFLIQAEVSEHQSCPYWHEFPCTRFDISNGTKHMIMFNVKHIIVRSDKLKKALRQRSDYRMVFVDDPYEVWELLDTTGNYVTVPEYEPVLFQTDNWRNDSYNWFRNMSLIDIPLVFVDEVEEEDKAVFKTVKYDGKWNDLPQIPIDNDCNIVENVSNFEIHFKTECVGKPHIISISNYPSWKAYGAKKIYLVSPSFMMVIPDQEEVRIVYSKRLIDWLGLCLTMIAVLIVGFGTMYYSSKRFRKKVDSTHIFKKYKKSAH